MKHSKGLELPINTIVIVAIAVLVLVVAAALFTTNVSVQSGALNLESAFARGCSTLRSAYSCDIGRWTQIKVTGYDSPKDNVQGDATLQQTCTDKGLESEACKKQCGC